MRHVLLLTLVIVTASCAAQRQPVAEPVDDEAPANPAFIAPDIYANRAQANLRERDQIRTGRYTLTSTLPSVAQEDLMAQIIEVTIPSTLKPTVGDAIRHALSRSGYSLSSDNTEASRVLYTRVLPAAHYKLGPMRLRDTLQVLAGPAWKVSIDEVTRQVSFSLRPGYQLPKIAEQKPKSDHNTVATAAGTTSQDAPATAASSNSAASAKLAGDAVLPKESSRPAIGSATGTPSTSAVSQISSIPTSPPSSPVPPLTAPTTGSTSSTSSAIPIAAPTPRPLPQVWTAEAGSTLRDSVEAWAAKAGWTVIWAQEDLNYPIAAPLRFEGSFTDAIDQLFPLYDQARRPFVVDGSLSQRVVHIDERKRK
ncbi:PFGI-1 class ICE element type IV pilus protein PilL2 [Pseudomonas lopnurensis]|uniref:PFGI-1 class ICE element type IV pilus protein PilL2 n=1 Tax=Pseudomonas lopnurensis TaxID=1477517 RepID=UPI0028AAC3B9|nr:TcpQ domain-containing protein [Pseudomonas lopnurensis]